MRSEPIFCNGRSHFYYQHLDNFIIYKFLFQAITSELGYVEDGVYYADENCKENLGEIINFLDQDDNNGSS